MKLRSARPSDLNHLLKLRDLTIAAVADSAYDHDALSQWRMADPSERYAALIEQQLMLVAEDSGRLLGCAGLLLENSELVAMFVHPDVQGGRIGSELLSAVRHLACDFGIDRLYTEASLNAADFYQRHGFSAADDQDDQRSQRCGIPVLACYRPLDDTRSDYQQQVMAVLRELGIPGNYGVDHRLRIQPECDSLFLVGEDVFERELYLDSRASDAWQRMHAAAAEDDVDLRPVSGYRSLEYQAGLVRRKLEAGQTIDQILDVSAAPGFSEHHSGRALDITTADSKPLETEFEDTSAFEWLTRRAGEFGFVMSYPRNNPHRISYEPWHWAFRGD